MTRRDSLWVVIHMARTKSQSDAAARLLRDEGFVVKTRSIDKAYDYGGDCHELLALYSEAKQARDLLHEAGL